MEDKCRHGEKIQQEGREGEGDDWEDLDAAVAQHYPRTGTSH
jgi:hypothetical protein